MTHIYNPGWGRKFPAAAGFGPRRDAMQVGSYSGSSGNDNLTSPLPDRLSRRLIYRLPKTTYRIAFSRWRKELNSIASERS